MSNKNLKVSSVNVKTAGPESNTFDVAVGDRVKFYSGDDLLIGSVFFIQETEKGPLFFVKVKKGKPVNHDSFISFNLDVVLDIVSKRKSVDGYAVTLAQIKKIYKIKTETLFGVNAEFITKEISLSHF